MIFCLDANAFIEPWPKRYPIDLFPDFWTELDRMAKEGNVLASDEVLHELKRIDDDLNQWASSRSHMFHPPDETVQGYVTAILNTYPRLIDSKKNRSAADPFVIGHAQATKAVVVTEELSAPGSKRPKIPDVCAELDIDCINVLDFMRRVGMKFRHVR